MYLLFPFPSTSTSRSQVTPRASRLLPRSPDYKVAEFRGVQRSHLFCELPPACTCARAVVVNGHVRSQDLESYREAAHVHQRLPTIDVQGGIVCARASAN